MIEPRDVVFAKWENKVRKAVKEAGVLSHPILINTFPAMYDNAHLEEALAASGARGDEFDTRARELELTLAASLARLEAQQTLAGNCAQCLRTRRPTAGPPTPAGAGAPEAGRTARWTTSGNLRATQTRTRSRRRVRQHDLRQ
jgi:hypothetical protein